MTSPVDAGWGGGTERVGPPLEAWPCWKHCEHTLSSVEEEKDPLGHSSSLWGEQPEHTTRPHFLQ